MDERLKQLTDMTADMLGLDDNYTLCSHHLYYDNQALNQTRYLLTSVWFPKNAEQLDENDESNPPGTVVVDMDIHAQTLKQVVFAHDQSHADVTQYPNPVEADVIEWLEDVTGLVYGKQFTPGGHEDNTFYFTAAVDHIPVSPPGSIIVSFANERLVSLTVNGHFPDDSEVDWEPFALTEDRVAEISQAQCRRIELPFEAKETWLPLYTIEEIFVTNDALQTIPIDLRAGFGTATEQDLILEWEQPQNNTFEEQELAFDVRPSIEDVFNETPHPDTLPITTDIENACINEVKRYMQHVFPEDSGQWRLVWFRRENGYIFAELAPVDVNDTSFHRKIQVALDGTSYQALNAFDNQMLIEMLNDFVRPEGSEISAENAFDKLRNHIELVPTYVYDQSTGRYILCGRLDCAYGVEAKTGDVVALDELNV